MKIVLKKYWFTIGLIIAFLLPFIDITGVLSKTGIFFKENNGPDFVIILIFLFSGLVLENKEIRNGITDFLPVFISLFLIFVVSPAICFFMFMVPMNVEIAAGLAIVAVMPTTLSSGVVMTGICSGNKAQALLITIISNFIATFSIPFSLGLIFDNVYLNDNLFDPFALMIKIGCKVLIPLAAGYFTGIFFTGIRKFSGEIQIANQMLILSMVWMSSAAAGESFFSNTLYFFIVLVCVSIFHIILLICSFICVFIFKLEKGRKEAVIFMGSQKTLPLSLIVQVSIFPGFALSLAVCVVHHVVQLIFDSFIQAKLVEK